MSLEFNKGFGMSMDELTGVAENTEEKAVVEEEAENVVGTESTVENNEDKADNADNNEDGAVIPNEDGAVIVDANGEVVDEIDENTVLYIDENGNPVTGSDVKIPDGLVTLTKGYMDYVKYVIFERAFVNIDGLKPSQRRILVTMEEIEKAHNLTKCATIVGSTLKLHPHGDCLRGNTVFEGLDGYRYTIKELYENSVSSLEVLAFDSKTAKPVPAIAHSFRIGQYTDKVYHIRFTNGGEICVTANHPLLVKDGGEEKWVKAENLKPNTEIVSLIIDKAPKRPKVTYNGNMTMLQTIVMPNIAKGRVRHHKNGNPRDNRLSNLVDITRAEHASVHSDKSNLDALAAGRTTMFGTESSIRGSIREKNSSLMSTYNANQGLYKAFAVLKYMRDCNIALTVDNYNKARQFENCGIYNATSVDRLCEKYGTFDRVVSLFNSNYSPVREQRVIAPHNYKCDSSGGVKHHSNKVANDRKYFNAICRVMDRHPECCNMVDLTNAIKRDRVVLSATKLFDYYETFEDFLLDYNKHKVRVASIDVEIVKSEPMYDFTVDTLENAFIPLCLNKTELSADTFICVHNSSVYATLCRMIDSAGFWNVPIIKGKGSFQKTYTTAPSSASRYTECRLMDEASLYFDDIAGVNRVGNYDNSRTEPELLPVKYPAVLCNASSGIAVGLASNIPSFNFNEVLEATIEVIKTGTLSKPLAPDFSGGEFGGEYVRNETELWKIMHKGKGTIQLRGKWTINKRFITITEIPYYTTEEAIKKVADSLPEVRSCTSLSDINGMEIQVECMNQQVTEQVLQQLLKNSDLQMNVTACIMIIVNNKVPQQLGVIDVIKEWVKFRKGVLTKLFTQRVSNLKYDIEKYGAFLTLILDKEFKQRFIDALSGSTEERAEDVLEELLPGLDRSIYTWILDRKIRTLASPITIQMKVEGYKRELADVEAALADLDSYIIKELTELNKKYKYPRKTVVTDVSMSINKRLIENYDVSVAVEDNFIKKYKGNTSAGVYHCKNEATIVMFDDLGRIIKIPLRDIPETTGKSAGVYIPTHLKIAEDFKVKYSTICTDKVVGYLHKDGWINTIDYNEWTGNKRNKRVIDNGYPSPETLFAVYNTDVPYSLILTNYDRVGVFESGYRVKSRTARTKYVKLKEGEEIVSYIPLTAEQYIQLVKDEANLAIGKFRRASKVKWNTDVFKKLDAESYLTNVIAKDGGRAEEYRVYLDTMKRVEETLRKEREAREAKERELAERNDVTSNEGDVAAISGDITEAVVEVTMGSDVLKPEE